MEAASKLLGPKAPRPLKKGEFLQNKNGSKSTERTISVNHPDLNGGRPTLIPTIYVDGGKIVEHSSMTATGEIDVSRDQEEAATRAAIASGMKYPDFDDHDKATKFAIQRSKTGGVSKHGSLGKAPPPLGKIMSE